MGTIFAITADGQFSTLAAFDNSNGNQPEGGCIEGADGDFYGATFAGGYNGVGAVFRYSPATAGITPL